MIPAPILLKWWQILHNQFTVVTILAVAVGCSFSRIYLGYHTTNQVLVGACLGSIGGAGWYAIFEKKLVRDCLMLVDGILIDLERERRCQCCSSSWCEVKSNGKDN
jgi:membrane-associated phospholipid phosphatase